MCSCSSERAVNCHLHAITIEMVGVLLFTVRGSSAYARGLNHIIIQLVNSAMHLFVVLHRHMLNVLCV